MRVLVQRVLNAQVIIDNHVYAQIDRGLLVFAGIHKTDTNSQVKWLARKSIYLRLFEDSDKKMNLSVDEIEGEVLIISQFTLYGNCQTGRRPDFIDAAKGEKARELYDLFVKEMKELYPKVKTGIFGAEMKIKLLNDGPATFLIEK